MTDRMGWTCPICGTTLSPCCAATVAATLPHLAAAAPHAAPQAAVAATASRNAGKKASSSRAKPLDYEEPNFKAFWEAYPLKKGKASAFRKFAAAVAAGAAPQEVIAAALRYRNDPMRDPDFTKWPEGWLTARRWEDEPTLAVAPPSSIRVKSADEVAADWERQRADDDRHVANLQQGETA